MKKSNHSVIILVIISGIIQYILALTISRQLDPGDTGKLCIQESFIYEWQS